MQRLLILGALLLVTPPRPSHAQAQDQDQALIEALAPILMTEDRRVLDPGVLLPSLEHPDATVRRAAVLAVGRIGNPDGVLLVAPRLRDRDPLVVLEAIFALGLLKDARGVPLLMDRLRLVDTLSPTALAEASTALAKIGGAEAASALSDVLTGSGDLREDRRREMRPAAILESFRLGALAPASAILPFTRDVSTAHRWRALYVLGRLAVPAVGDAMLAAARDPEAMFREVAARSLTRRLADTASLPHRTVIGELLTLLDDRADGVRINAIGSLATFRDTSTVDRIAGRLRDTDRGARVAAAGALSAIGGTRAAAALTTALDDRDQEWAVRRVALAGLARLDTAAFSTRAAAWLAGTSPYDRIAALDAWGTIPGAGRAVFATGVRDPDARVRAAALGAWRTSAGVRDSSLLLAATTAWRDPDPLVRASALPVLADTASDAALDLLTSAWASDNGDLREAALSALIRVSRGDRAFLGRLVTPARRAWLDRPSDPLLRATAQRGFPALAARWGAVTPIETGRTLQDYRELVARFLLARDNPRVVIDVESRGRIELELFSRDAPLTVANYLRLVDRAYFDNGRWHRVVPNFVVQDGDPTGTGSGGPGWSIRDEINRWRYESGVVGMALSGPDTGGSQWFITLSPQPHLDGGYTVFGRVTAGHNVVSRVMQGDRIRSIARVTGP
jgi:cyclophilin family peptidyl-prolyl cis-trans isomerase/HEAT repeat protein